MEKQEKWLQDFGLRLRAEREKQGMTQQTLASKAHTKNDYIAQIERGVRNPSLRTLMNILGALDISADYLIYGTSNENRDEMAELIAEFTSFLSRRNVGEVASYLKIVRFMAEFVEGEEEA